MSNLVEEIEAQIAGAKQGVAKENVGVVREISDGVAKIGNRGRSHHPR